MADKQFSIALSKEDEKALNRIKADLGKTIGRVSHAAAIRAAIRGEAARIGK